MTTITLTLPERTMEQAQQAAAVLQRPVEDVLRDLLAAVLPTMHDARMLASRTDAHDVA